MRSDELTSSSSPRGPGTTSGVLCETRSAPRSTFHRSFPVRASSASRYDVGLVVAEQDEEIAVAAPASCRAPTAPRTARTPSPRWRVQTRRPVHVERHDLAVAEPGVDALAVGDRRRGRQVVLLVQLGERPGRPACDAPRAAAPSDATNASTTSHTLPPASRRVARARRSAVSRSASARSSRASRGCASPPRPAPRADLRRDEHAVAPRRSATTCRAPASGARQAMFSFALHVVGSADSDDTP